MQGAAGTTRALTDGWRAAVADEHLRRVYTDDDVDSASWRPIDVPGHWRSSAAFTDADGPLLYRCRFDAPPPPPGRRSWLTFEGLFSQGDVWLDGGYLGDTEGYFLPHSFEVTDALADRSGHTLAVEVTSAPQRTAASKRNLTGVFQSPEIGGAAAQPGGIWRPVRLDETGPVRIAGLRVLCVEATPERAVLRAVAALDSDGARHVRLRTEVGDIDHEIEHPLAAGSNEVTWSVTIDHPALWWPRALGDAVLHDVRVAVLLADGGPAGGDGASSTAPTAGDATVSDERRLRTGLRAVRLRNWIASVNGERLFLKGTNLAPTRLALGEATPDELRRDVDLAVEAGLDLVRVHAHVTRAEVYDHADERGLLVWQDLPMQGPYARSVRKQAVRQARGMVDLLGHHPSIAVWCGHDESTAPVGPDGVEVLSRRADRWPVRSWTAQQLPTWNRTVLDRSVRRALHKADPSRPVVPQSGAAPHLPRLDGTDQHLWFGWNADDERGLPVLARRLPRLVRFVSQFGAQAVPSGDAAAFAAPERWPDLDWDRLARDHGLQRTVLDRNVPPDGYATFEGWRDATQRHQARVVRRTVEELRRLKYRPTGGCAQYLFADPAPAISFSVLDHDRRPKLAHDALRAACRPVIVVADRLPAAVAPGDTLALDVHVVSDLRVAVENVRATATAAWPGGSHTWRWRGDIDADTCERIDTLRIVVPEIDDDVGGRLTLDLALELPPGALADGEPVTNHDEAPFA
jgi:beta-mannosidase